jgi:hypothetical protein
MWLVVGASVDDFNARLEELNRRLRGLDGAHRLGLISRAEYRARRRRLLGTLGAGERQHGGGVAAAFRWWSRWLHRVWSFSGWR